MDLIVKSISELVNEKFFIPKYQRGYRWDYSQVKALLKDITDNEYNKKYCLQPIVVSKNKDGKWELLDGQQRLTTIYILIKYMKEYMPKIGEFSLEFETRIKSEEFLKNLSSDIENNNDNIDFHYICSAMQDIKKWFNDSSINHDKNTAVMNLHQKLFNDVQIIWYDIRQNISQDEKIQIFTRLNIGKIPLTAAELVKALFLQEKNFSIGNDVEYTKQCQLEIANDWDQIEYTLQEESFWYFLCGDNNKSYFSRIELLLELYLEEKKSKHSDPLWVYFQIQNKLDKKEITVKDMWSEIKHNFMILQEWYGNHKLYHYIGFLVTTGTSLQELLGEYTKYTKEDFLTYLIKKIGGGVRLDIESLSYGNNNNEITKILLLHNIQTIVSNEPYTRFPFNRYHTERWSLEHIHAQNSEELRTEKQWKEWLENHKAYLEEEIPNEIKKETFTILAEQIYKNYYKKYGKTEQEVDHSIRNLALLSSPDNASLSNSIFPIKRGVIIEKDKQGQFIPLCTKNIFLKYYNTDENQQISFWGEPDKDSYYKDILSVLKEFSGVKNEQ